MVRDNGYHFYQVYLVMIRVMAEGPTPAITESHCTKIAGVVKDILGWKQTEAPKFAAMGQ